MQRRSIPAILEEIGALLEIEGENPFKVKAYYNAAKVLAGLDDLDILIREGRLRKIRGIGETLSAKIIEYHQTGQIAYHEELKKRIPATLIELLQIPNLGPRKIKALYDELGVTTLGELEYACKENRLVSLFSFGKKTQEKILKGIEFLRRHKGEYLFGEVYPIALRLKQRFERVAPEEFVEMCGSIRRRNEVVRDIDILVGAEDRGAVSEYFTSMPEVEEVLAEGETKTSCRLSSGIAADLRVVDRGSFPCALVYFTGSKEHNVRLRGLAKKRGLLLNEYGMFRDGRPLDVRSEADLYEALGLSYVPPELREDRGEIEAAQAHTLPHLVEVADLKGTFHVHTEMSDGVDTLETIAKTARAMGLTYVGICDHSQTAAYAGGLKGEDVLRQWAAIDRFNAENADFCFLKGIESEILPDGRLDYAEELLSGFDFVVASVHSGFTMSRQDMEARIIRAMENPYTTILGHPTGRLLLARDGYEVDMRRLIEAAAALHVVIELNASPYRLDIDWRYLKEATEQGAMIAVNPDAHSANGLAELFYGIGIARKGWLEPADIVNTRDVQGVRDLFMEVRNGKRD
ncbi:MAG: DNA polymerase/3'-5' exonuclease PolX [Syntrophorhabdales bacterium]|jgi:DNA polymerase (family 10)